MKKIVPEWLIRYVETITGGLIAGILFVVCFQILPVSTSVGVILIISFITIGFFVFKILNKLKKKMLNSKLSIKSEAKPFGIMKMINILAIGFAIFSIWWTYVLSSPIELNIWHEIGGDNRLIIWAKNENSFKSTGTINLFRLEKNFNKPHMQLDPLKPKEERKLAELSIKIEKENVTITTLEDDIALLGCQLPASKFYYITEDTSISYKITCENCPSQGIIKRIPDFGQIQMSISLSKKHIKDQICEGALYIYSWTDFDLEDVIKE